MKCSRLVRRKLKYFSRRNDGRVSADFLRENAPETFFHFVEIMRSSVQIDLNPDDLSFGLDGKGNISRVSFNNSSFCGGTPGFL